MFNLPEEHHFFTVECTIRQLPLQVLLSLPLESQTHFRLFPPPPLVLINLIAIKGEKKRKRCRMNWPQQSACHPAMAQGQMLIGPLVFRSSKQSQSLLNRVLMFPEPESFGPARECTGNRILLPKKQRGRATKQATQTQANFPW